jgi:hypothetical protein
LNFDGSTPLIVIFCVSQFSLSTSVSWLKTIVLSPPIVIVYSLFFVATTGEIFPCMSLSCSAITGGGGEICLYLIISFFLPSYPSLISSIMPNLFMSIVKFNGFSPFKPPALASFIFCYKVLLSSGCLGGDLRIFNFVYGAPILPARIPVFFVDLS